MHVVCLLLVNIPHANGKLPLSSSRFAPREIEKLLWKKSASENALTNKLNSLSVFSQTNAIFGLANKFVYLREKREGVEERVSLKCLVGTKAYINGNYSSCLRILHSYFNITNRSFCWHMDIVRMFCNFMQIVALVKGRKCPE